MLIYMGKVKAGGETVFPDLNLTISPNKGSAVFWYNLLNNGTKDYSTLHAACPVLLGTKWSTLSFVQFLPIILFLCINYFIIFVGLVLNKWIRERGQEFRRPCTLV